MLMPEAVIYEYYGIVLRQDEIWFARQILAVELKAKPSRVEALADHQFGLRIFALDARHHLAAL